MEIMIVTSLHGDFDVNSGGEEKDQRNGDVEQLLYHWKNRGKGIAFVGLP